MPLHAVPADLAADAGPTVWQMCDEQIDEHVKWEVNIEEHVKLLHSVIWGAIHTSPMLTDTGMTNIH